MARASEFVPLATAPSQMVAEMWRELLAEEGIVTLLQPGNGFVFLGAAAEACRVLVPAVQRAAAEALLSELTPPADGEG